ncbi:hypothetical protein AVEN_198813-1 [Araneus ventricosus]|uniref:Uncharacterized protein n=1 Tax=Araneus ventricosus TaxID=182803 RepID=A0A4Y2KGN5_ARAVE|nr:hypothetical protein AVEN_198813-1 [Araneus ventricosus]
MKRKLELYKASVKETDERLFSREFTSRYVSSEPFFVWKNEQYGNEISQLLSGKEIVLKADVKKSEPGKDAIKFRSVELYFKSKNKTIQSQVNDTLKKFDICATHLGNSYYRYEDRIHVISSPKRTIFYSFEKNRLGDPIHKNQVYKKLSSGDLMLSPYAMWMFKLNSTKKNAFLELETFKGLIDLELEGHGSYVAGEVGSLLDEYETDHEQRVFEKSNIAFDSNNRYIRSLDHADNFNNFATSTASGLSSPISYMSNFLKIYFVFVMNSVNKLLFNYNETLKSTVVINIPERAPIISSDPSKIISAVGRLEEIFSSVLGNDSVRKEIIHTDLLKRKYLQRIIKKPSLSSQSVDNDRINKPNFGTRFNCLVDDYTDQAEPVFLGEPGNGQHNQIIQAPDLNYSLFLADFVARYFTGIKYESEIESALLSPKKAIAKRINGCIFQTDNDINQSLFSLLKSKEANGNSLCSKLKNYVYSAFHFLGFVKKEDVDDFILDIRNLFVCQEPYAALDL